MMLFPQEFIEKTKGIEGKVRISNISQGSQISFNNQGEKHDSVYEGVDDRKGIPHAIFFSRYTSGVIRVFPFVILGGRRKKRIDFSQEISYELCTEYDEKYNSRDQMLRGIRK